MKNEKFLFATVKGFNDDGTMNAVASTEAIDREGEVIALDAWKDSLPTFRTNPVILATHMHRLSTGDSPVIGSAVKIGTDGGSLAFTVSFASTPFGEQYRTLYREGHMRAFSVGFIPLEGERRTVGEGADARRVFVHTKADLLEISAVPVPANPEALARMRAAAAAGLDDDAMVRLAELVAERIGKAGDVDLLGAIDKRMTDLDERIAELMDLLPDTVNEAAAGDDNAPRPHGTARDAEARAPSGANQKLLAAAERLRAASKRPA